MDTSTLRANVIFTLPIYPPEKHICEKGLAAGGNLKDLDPSLIQGGSQATVHIYCPRTSKEALM